MRVLFAGATVAGLVLVARIASAQNADPFFYGDEAALAAGAVVASGRDSGAFWYNPAGFAGLGRGLLSASASTFGVRVRKVPEQWILRVGSTADRNALSSVDVISVPNAVVAATEIGDRFALAGGLLTTQRDVRSGLIDFGEALRTTNEGEQLLIAQRFDVQVDSSKYHFGGAFAAKLTNQLRVGGALYGTYGKRSVSVQHAFSLRNPGADPYYFVTNLRATGSAVGLAATVGAQYDVTSSVTLGLTVRSPEVPVTQSIDGGVLSGASPGASLVSQTAAAPEAGAIVNPMRVLAGVAFALGPPQSFVEIGADFSHGLPASASRNGQRPTVNARAGVRYMLSPEWIVGGGVFSDRATIRELGAYVTGDDVDWYGLTAGVSKRTPLALSKNPSPEALVLVTTLSLRAAAGLGTARGIDFHILDPDPQRPIESDVTYFELMPYLGSSVNF